ncbi:MAG: hypothetical protein M5U28_10585 [Sandaracinaceae bacterium]|nr:hypothetical protein [Sandaracinaceae bacterium]
MDQLCDLYFFFRDWYPKWKDTLDALEHVRRPLRQYIRSESFAGPFDQSRDLARALLARIEEERADLKRRTKEARMGRDYWSGAPPVSSAGRSWRQDFAGYCTEIHELSPADIARLEALAELRGGEPEIVWEGGKLFVELGGDVAAPERWRKIVAAFKKARP